MKNFLDDNFLLQNKTAELLYHKNSKQQPIIDYHCHLPPEDIANDRQFKSITEVWLEGDHYKWRAMRTNGAEEKYCTGNASDYEKFEKWAETVPYTLRNPLYHWTHLELQRYFGVTSLLNKDTAKDIYERCNKLLNTSNYSARNLMLKMNVEVVCTTDDPIDTLEHHIKIKEDNFKVKVLPTWRPDKAMAVDSIKDYNDYVDRLSESAGITISKFDDLLEALQIRHDFFAEAGCKLSDHGIDTIYAEDYTDKEIQDIFAKARDNKALTKQEILQFKSAMLYHFAVMDWEKGWTQQLHIGALRNNNTRMMKALGPDTGFDSIGDFKYAVALSKLLDKLDSEDKLAKTIIYNLNPVDNEMIATMIGNFNVGGSVAGKIQFGSGWWFLDQKNGMEKQMNTLSVLGLLSRFVGMLTDSRSFMSYPRHEYFRRILCNLLGKDVENGELPNDINLLGNMVENISYHNAKNYFEF